MPKQSRDSGWAKRLRLDDLPRDEKMAKKKLKRYYGKLGFSNCVPENMTTYDSEFGRLRFESNHAMQRKRDFSGPFVNVYGDKNDYAL